MGDPKWDEKLKPVLAKAVTLASNLLGPDSTFLEKLVETKCLTTNQTASINRSWNKDGKTQAAKELFQTLWRRPTPYFDVFCTVLAKVDQGEDLRCLLLPERTSEAVAATSRERRQEETPTPFDDYLDKEVTDKERIEAAKRIQSRWQRIGRILGPKPFKDYELAAFEQKKEYRDQAQAMLDAWANTYYKKATRRCLIKAMEREGLAKAAAEVFSNSRAKEEEGAAVAFEPRVEILEDLGPVKRRREPRSSSLAEKTIPKPATDEKADSGTSFLPKHTFEWCLLVFIVVAAGGAFLYAGLLSGSGETSSFASKNSALSKDAKSDLTGATVSMKELEEAIINVGQLKWEDIAQKLDWSFHKIQVHKRDNRDWTSKENLQYILLEYKQNNEDSESSRQRLINACTEVKIGGALRDELKRQGVMF